MLKLNVISLIVVGLSLAVNLTVDAETSFNPVDMNQEEMDDCLKLAPLFSDISKKLEEKLPEPKEQEENIAVAKEILDEIEKEKYSLRRKLRSWKLKQALRLFVSLEGVETQCNLDGYKIISKNYICIERNQAGKSRVRAVLNHYLTKHAEFCRSDYKKRFAEQIKNVPDLVKTKIKGMMEGQNYESFHCERQSRDSSKSTIELEMGMPSFIGSCAVISQSRLAKNLNQLKKNIPGWDLVKSELSRSGKKSKLIHKLFDDNLFTPCEKYHDLLADILTPARMDAAIKDSKQKDFISGDEDFYQAMIYNRYCRALLRERARLYKSLANEWRQTWRDTNKSI